MIDLGALSGRVAGAPISWGVCEAPDWGEELPASLVLEQMRSLGLQATELGPTGYLGPDPDAVAKTLAEHGMRLVGGFLPVALHVAPEIDLAEVEAAVRTLAAAGSEVVVLAARSTDGAYDRKVRLDDDEWAHLVGNIHRVCDLVADLGLRSAFHPHVGTPVESWESVQRLLDDTGVSLCLDTGHLVIGGGDPLELVRLAGERIGHVHLKDVRLEVAGPVAAGSVSFLDGVRSGLFAPLGDGDLDVAGVVAELESAGFAGWYVLEQDVALSGLPSAGEGPVRDVRRSLDFLRHATR